MQIYTTLELNLEVIGEYFPEAPGNYSGLPENCFPTEPEDFEIKEAKVLTTDKQGRQREYKCPDFLVDLLDMNYIKAVANEQYKDWGI